MTMKPNDMVSEERDRALKSHLLDLEDSEADMNKQRRSQLSGYPGTLAQTTNEEKQ